MSAQKWYQLEAHRHGKGGWALRGPVHPSKHHATEYARSKGWKDVSEVVNGSGAVVYRIVEVLK